MSRKEPSKEIYDEIVLWWLTLPACHARETWTQWLTLPVCHAEGAWTQWLTLWITIPHQVYCDIIGLKTANPYLI